MWDRHLVCHHRLEACATIRLQIDYNKYTGETETGKFQIVINHTVMLI